MSIMTTAPTATDGDVGSYVYRALAEHSHVAGQRWSEKFLQCHPAWRYGPLPSQLYQIREINWFLRVNLGMLEMDTAAYRAALIDDIELADWRTNFDMFIQPICVARQLPFISWSEIVN